MTADNHPLCPECGAYWACEHGRPETAGMEYVAPDDPRRLRRMPTIEEVEAMGQAIADGITAGVAGALVDANVAARDALAGLGITARPMPPDDPDWLQPMPPLGPVRSYADAVVGDEMETYLMALEPVQILPVDDEAIAYAWQFRPRHQA